MIKMMHFIYRSFFPALLCLSNQGNLVWGNCTEQNVQIEGGFYTLSNGLEEGSQLTYECEVGFYPNPALTHVCSYNGKWDPAPRRSKCTPVECPNPPVLDNCNVLPSEPQYFYRDQITYECHKGYTLFGPSYRICLWNGEWSGSHPVCRLDSENHCPNPGVPLGDFTHFNIGRKVTYKCRVNAMTLVGPKERVCQEDGHWSGEIPSCFTPYTQNYEPPLASLETEPRKGISLSKSGTLNMYIALDVSSSITEKDFRMAKQAVITLMEKIASFSVTSNYDVMLFSSTTVQVIDILSFFDGNKKPLAELVNHLKNFEIQRSDEAGTNLRAVFERFYEKIAILKVRLSANFAEHHHAIFVFTNGQLNIGGNPIDIVERIKATVLMGQQKEREEHLDIYIFGIGHPIYAGNLQGVAVGTGKHYLRLENLDNWQETLDEILDEEEDIKGLCGLYRDYTYGGAYSETKRWKYPWALSVYIMTNSWITFRCQGSLVSPHFVLTAASCVSGIFFKEARVEVDARYQLGVKRVIIHPLYNISAKSDQGIREFFDYDVALLELYQNVKISASLRPICLPCTKETNDALGQSLTCQQQEELLITNRQRINFLTKKRQHFYEKSAHIELENRENCICKALIAPGITSRNCSMVVTENFLCTGGIFNEEDHIACKGDSGGAVFKNYLNRTIQVAVVSWGNKDMPACGRGEIPLSDQDSRDFHLNLFKVVPFLKYILGRTDQNYVPLVFVD